MDETGIYLTIGGAAKATGCKPETIRYYERIGLLAAPLRSAGGHRHFSRDEIKRLNFVRRARGLGFGLGAVRSLLVLADGGEQSCAAAEKIASHQLSDVRAKLDDLAAMERVLANMVRACAGGTLPVCPLLDTLFEDRPRQPGARAVPLRSEPV